MFVLIFAERYEGVEGESAQRCKARLERHRRTAERAVRDVKYLQFLRQFVTVFNLVTPSFSSVPGKSSCREEYA